MRAEVIGGSARFSVYLTVVSSFATDLDAALQYHGDGIVLDRDKGLPIVTWDTTTDQWIFQKSINGRLQVDVPNVIQTTQQTINFRRYNQSLTLAKNVPTVHVDYTVPSGKRLFWIGGRGSADGWVKWTVDVGGVRYLTSRNAFDKPDAPLHLDAPLILAAGERIIVTVENVGNYGTLTEVETFFFGAMEDV
jgi:hypothetical protein